MSVAIIAKAKQEGRRVIAVGTTTVRTLEGLYQGATENPTAQTLKSQILKTPQPTTHNPIFGWINLYITPSYRLKVVDALITNFHLPKSSLLVLLAAFMGDVWEVVYTEAIAE